MDVNQFPTASDGNEHCQWLHSLSFSLSLSLSLYTWMMPVSAKGLSDWSLFRPRSTFLLLFFKTQLQNLIIFCIVIKSQILNKAPRSPPAHITSSFVVVVVRTNKSSTHEPSWLSISCKWHLAHRTVACMWVWQAEGEVVPVRWVLFEPYVVYSALTYDRDEAQIYLKLLSLDIFLSISKLTQQL